MWRTGIRPLVTFRDVFEPTHGDHVAHAFPRHDRRIGAEEEAHEFGRGVRAGAIDEGAGGVAARPGEASAEAHPLFDQRVAVRGVEVVNDVTWDELTTLDPGCTMATRSGDVLIVENDIGETSAHVLVVHIESVFFQCSRALIRSDLWNPARHLDTKSLPTPGEILASMTDNQVGGQAYDQAWPERAKQTMW